MHLHTQRYSGFSIKINLPPLPRKKTPLLEKEKAYREQVCARNWESLNQTLKLVDIVPIFIQFTQANHIKCHTSTKGLFFLWVNWDA